MVKITNVLNMLIPQGGWSLIGDDFNDINWIDKSCQITEDEYKAGVLKYDAWKADQDAQVIAKKEAAQAKLAALGLTADDLNALGL